MPQLKGCLNLAREGRYRAQVRCRPSRHSPGPTPPTGRRLRVSAPPPPPPGCQLGPVTGWNDGLGPHVGSVAESVGPSTAEGLADGRHPAGAGEDARNRCAGGGSAGAAVDFRRC